MKKKILRLVLILLSIILIIFIFFKSEIKRNLFNKSYRKYYLNKEKDIYFESPLIKEIEYNFTSKEEKNNKPEKIIFHHCARSVWSPEDINEYHKERGFIGIGYHYYIRKDGFIYKGRDEDSTGAHTKGENTNSIGICLEGNFEIESITDEQRESLINLAIYIISKYEIKDMRGHRLYAETLCPGKNFNEDEIKNNIIKKLREF
jgi:N-acetylmuramoyl-L-alanine amidase